MSDHNDERNEAGGPGDKIKVKPTALSDMLSTFGLGYLRNKKEREKRRKAQNIWYYLPLSIPVLLAVAQSLVILVSGGTGSGSVHDLRIIADDYDALTEEIGTEIKSRSQDLFNQELDW